MIGSWKTMFFGIGLTLSTIVYQSAEPKYPPWPTAPVIVVPVPPNSVTILKPEYFYVVQSDSPSLLLPSPNGVVTITEETGPIRLRGKFVDGNGQVESRTYSGKQVWIVEGLSSGDVELLKVPHGAKTEKEVERRSIRVEMGVGPIPPPNPKPDPEPIPGDPVLVKKLQEALAKDVALKGNTEKTHCKTLGEVYLESAKKLSSSTDVINFGQLYTITFNASVLAGVPRRDQSLSNVRTVIDGLGTFPSETVLTGTEKDKAVALWNRIGSSLVVASR